MPWRNGGGVTIELFVLPAGAGIDSFTLRLSRASITSDGPFSRFPDVDRSLAIVRGAGVDLLVEGHAAKVRLDATSAPFAFAGELAIDATLVSGPVEDFNVMTRRQAFGQALAWESLDGVVPLARRGALVAFVLVDGALDVGGARLSPGEAVVHDGAEAIALCAARARGLRVDVFAR